MTTEETIKGLTDLKELAKELIFEDSDDMLLSLDNAIKTLKREETCENVEDSFMMFECSKCGARSVECMLTFEYCPSCGRRVKK